MSLLKDRIVIRAVEETVTYYLNTICLVTKLPLRICTTSNLYFASMILTSKDHFTFSVKKENILKIPSIETT